jgi:hypothetical protein
MTNCAKQIGLLLSTASRPALRPNQPPIQRVQGDTSRRVKWLEHEANLSPPSSVEVKNPWSYNLPSQSRPANHCWPSPAQSFLVSGPVGIHDQICVHSKTVYVFGNGVSSSMAWGPSRVKLWCITKHRDSFVSLLLVPDKSCHLTYSFLYYLSFATSRLLGPKLSLYLNFKNTCLQFVSSLTVRYISH